MRLAHAQEERIAPVAPDEQGHEGRRADAGHAGRRPRHLDEPEAPEQLAVVGRQGRRVAGQRRLEDVEPVQRRDEGRRGPQARQPVDDVAQRAQHLDALAGARGVGLAAPPARPLALEVALEPVLEPVDGQARVPRLELPAGGEVAQRAPVGAGRGGGEVPAGGGVPPGAAGGHDQARRQPLDVPLPRPGEGVVQLVDVEDQPATGRGEEPEVRHVGVAAELHAQAGGRGCGQVGGHDRRALHAGRPAARRASVRGARARGRGRATSPPRPGSRPGRPRPAGAAARRAPSAGRRRATPARGRRAPRAWRTARRVASLAGCSRSRTTSPRSGRRGSRSR